MNIPAPSTSESSAPQIEDGLYKATFNDIYYKVHPDWAQEKDKFGHKDDGGRFHFSFTILDDDGQPLLREDAEDPDQTFDIEAMTRNMSSHEKSNSYALLKGILTPAEFIEWLNSTPENPADLSDVANRVVNVQVSHNSKGWPQIEATLGPVKKGK
jgi:hypothetical protein